MILVNFDIEGGRPANNDDFKILQEQLYKAIELQFQGSGAFILQNVTVTSNGDGTYNISSGLVFINGKVLEFDAVVNVPSFPRYIVQAADVDIDTTLTELGDSFPKRTIQKAELVSSAPGSGEFITMSSNGGKTYYDVLGTQFVRLSGNQNINGQKNFTSSVISNGINLNDALSVINSAGWVTAGRISDGNVTQSKIATNSIDSTRLTDNSVTTSKMVDSSVTSSKIANDAIGSNHLAAGSVSTSEITDTSVTYAKLASDITSLFSGNNVSTDTTVDFTTISTLSTRTYSNKLFTLTNNTSKVRPYVKFQMQAARDSGGSDFLKLELQRSPNGVSSFTTICTRNYKLDGDSWTLCIIDTVDTGATAGSNYYRVVATVTSGGLCYMSNNIAALIFGVNVF